MHAVENQSQVSNEGHATSRKDKGENKGQGRSYRRIWETLPRNV